MKLKRLLSLVFALFLIFFQPFEAYASSGLGSSETGSVGDADSFITASGYVGGTVSLSGYLSASGIHLSASGGTFSDVELELGNLWGLYQDTVSGVKDLVEYTGAVVRGGYVLARDAWNAFGGFGRWLKEKFNLTDNTENVSLSDNSNLTAYLSTEEILLGNGRTTGSTYFSNLRMSLVQPFNGLYVFYGHNLGGNLSDNYYVMIYNTSDTNFYGNLNIKYKLQTSGREVQQVITENVRAGQSKETSYIISSNFNDLLQKVNGTTVNPEEPTEDSILTVDTSEISIPDDIPDTATGSSSLGGIMLPALGAGLGGAAGAIASAIIDGIMGGVMPDIDIHPADVNLPPDMEIDDDGNVFPKDIEFRPTDVFLDSDAYKLDSLHNYFPFSIPWDLLNFAAMFRAEPEIPILDFVIPMPDGIDDITIHVDLTPFDSVAILSRSGIFVLFAIRWLMFLYRKFG